TISDFPSPFTSPAATRTPFGRAESVSKARKSASRCPLEASKTWTSGPPQVSKLVMSSALPFPFTSPVAIRVPHPLAVASGDGPDRWAGRAELAALSRPAVAGDGDDVRVAVAVDVSGSDVDAALGEVEVREETRALGPGLVVDRQVWAAAAVDADGDRRGGE